MPRRMFGRVFVGCVLALSALSGQNRVSLRTAQTIIELEADVSSPRLLNLQGAGKAAVWVNQAAEHLIDFAEDGGRRVPIVWKLRPDAIRSDREHVAFVYECLAPKLRLTWEWKARDASGPIEHSIQIENLDRRELWIPLQDSLQFQWRADAQAGFAQHFVEKGSGKPSAEGTHSVVVPVGYRWEGLSSTYARLLPDMPREIIPWVAVENNSGSREGWYAGIEFSGRTHLTLARDRDSVSGSAGLNPNPAPFRTRLRPGARFDTPVAFLGAYSGGLDALGNVLRPWVRTVLANPRTWRNPNYPLLVNNTWGTGMQVDERLAQSMIRKSAALGLEMLGVDAGWFRGVGDWYPDPKKFPHGLAALADDAHRNGLKMGIWVDWTQAGLDRLPGALNLRDPKVNAWTVADVPAGWKPEPFKGLTIDIGVPEARAYAQREVFRLVNDYHLDMLEHDGYLVAQGCVRTDHPHASPDPAHLSISQVDGGYFADSSNSTNVSYHAVRAYYSIYEALRRQHPELLLEICNDGGRMVDFGSAAHGDYFSITDAYDPLSNRQAFYDASHVLPPAMLEAYVEKWPAPHIENFRYMLRSGMMGWLTIMLDTNAWTQEQSTAAKEELRLYKAELRAFIRDADLYHVAARPDGVHWDGIEYFNPRAARGVVYAFRGSVKNEDRHSYPLRGVTPAARYRLRFHDGSSPGRTVSGRELLDSGLAVNLPSPHSSELIFIDAVTR